MVALEAAWAIRVSGEVFAEQLLRQLVESTTPPPDGTELEDAPGAQWREASIDDTNGWAAVGSFGVKKKNACNGLLGPVDVSVTVDSTLL
ncbi:MAG TPA: hypothetical protein VE664_02800 [Actinomycetes bacterium]|nr:hypothetical protein [Actinomycetes bacterium]